MTHPDGTPYSIAERRAIVLEARRAASELLKRIEVIAMMDGVPYDPATMVDQLREGTQGDDGKSNGGI